MPDSWIEKLFRKLEDFYGAKWAAQYGALPRDRVMRTWAEELSGFFDQPERIAYAMQQLREHPFPPTLPEFIVLCRQAPQKPVQALPHKLTPEEIERNRSRIAEISQQLASAKRMDRAA